MKFVCGSPGQRVNVNDVVGYAGGIARRIFRNIAGLDGGRLGLFICIQSVTYRSLRQRNVGMVITSRVIRRPAVVFGDQLSEGVESKAGQSQQGRLHGGKWNSIGVETVNLQLSRAAHGQPVINLSGIVTGPLWDVKPGV